MEEQPKSHKWWQTIPGILTTTVGIITGLTGLIVALQQIGFFQKNPEPQVNSKELDLCQQLNGYAINLTANNYHGVIGPAGIAIQQNGAGVFRFATSVVFVRETNREFSAKISDQLIGTCQRNFITFTRKLRDASVQTFSGIISKAPGGAITIEGFFRDENDKEYGWSGRVINPTP